MTFKPYFLGKTNCTFEIANGWSVIVRVGCDGTEVRVKICELHSKVQAACWLWCRWKVLADVDCG